MKMTKDVDAALEKQFNDAGIFFLKGATLDDVRETGAAYMGVDVEIGLPPGAEPKVPDFTFSVVNKRGVAMLFTNWSIKERAGLCHLTFEAWQRCQQLIDYRQDGVYTYAMSFTDFCFYQGNEAIPENYGEDVLAKIRLDAYKADLGWIMPVRLADTLIDALGKMNDAVLGGALGDAMLYGINIKEY